ncbi:hypothetical protein [Mycetocola spongiae]|uniref:hypothetical protein n=1 Tax=Mycetocola spongiae TaxID=2859226 RepID=UPI001CF45ED0|nr:hypothetical protein [Mycetocola spongiae]UCR89090.1 hypothetical protein KXZ72_14320 [Mycetocola spongiae]
MVAQLLRLRLQVLANAFRRGSRDVLRLVLGILITLALVYVLGLGLMELHTQSAEIIRDVITVAGSFILLGFFIVPLISRGHDSLDPRRFALFGLNTRSLAAGLALAGLLSIPVLALFAVAALSATAWAGHPAAVTLALLGAIIAVVTATLLGRLAQGLSSLFLARRKSREFSWLVSLLLLVLVGPALVLGASVLWNDDGLEVLGGVGDIIAWTPLGAVWSAPGDAALGLGGLAAARVAIALLTVAVLAWAWVRLVGYLAITPERSLARASIGGLGWFDALPGRPAAVIAARSMTYWVRDPRYVTSLLIIPVVPLVSMFALNLAGVAWQPLALLPMPILVAFLAWSVHNDLALDSSALWLHVASGVSGSADRLGRTFPVLLFGIPFILIGSMISVGLYGDWALLPAMLGVCVSLLLTGLGLASYFSARTPYPAVQPGDSPFQQPQTGGGYPGAVQAFSLVGMILLSAPTLYIAWRALVLDPAWSPVALAAGVGIGLVVFIGGIWAGGRYFDRHTPELMGFATAH